MPAILPPAPVNPTGELAQNLPGYDPAPAIAAQEQSLQEFLNLPVKEILARLGLPPFENAKPPEEALPEEERPPEGEPPPASPMDPSALISPVTDALSTLGSGLFEGVDPTAMFQGISQAFQSTREPVQQSVGSLDEAWQGASGTAAAAKTTEAVANGTEVASQSDALRASLETAATNVAQARVRLIEIITEFQATLAAIGPNIIFPWGWAAAIAAANKAIASTAEVMTELQSSLAAQAAEVTAAGAPVEVTPSPQTSAPTTGGASPMSSLASPLMSMATKGAQAGIQAGTGAASAASQAAVQTPPESAAVAGGAAAPLPAGAGATGGGAGGGGAGGAAVPRSMAMSSMVQPETASTSTQSAAVRASGGAGGAGGMMGAPYAPMAGAGHGGNASSNSHTAASFLHTSDQGGEIVGDLGNAAPPVLGEADPNEAPDIELRI